MMLKVSVICLKVYHGSTFIVKEPDLTILNNRTDFGKGFYTTTDIKQAQKWAKIKKKRLNKLHENDDEIKEYVNVYDFKRDNSLSILEFEEATEEWLKFVFRNRQSNELVHQYDIVFGPVANDNLYQVLTGYEDGIYSVEETVKRLKTYLLSNQISFHTLKSLKTLEYIETIEPRGEENE